MEVKLGKQLFLDRHFGVIRTEQEAIWQNDGAPAVLLQPIHDDRHKEVGGFAAAKVSREILFHALFFVATIRRIHQNDIEAVALLVLTHILFQAVAMDDARVVDVVEQHIRGAQEERQRLLFNAIDGVAVNRSVLDCLHLGIQHLQRRGEEAACTAGEVRNRLAELWLDHLHHKRMKLDPKVYYKIDGGQLCLWLTPVYDLYTKYRKDYAIVGEVLTYAQFKKQLQHSEYFIASNQQKRIGTENHKCWIIDYELLRKNCDVTGLEVTEIEPLTV